MSFPAPADSAAKFMEALQDGSYYRDPGPVWRVMREAGTMVKVPIRNGVWLCTTWRACVALARDSRLSAARAGAIERAFPAEYRHEIRPYTEMVAEWVVLLDPPRHTLVRKLLNRAFTPEVIARNRERVAQIFDWLLDEWVSAGGNEIMQTLIHPFPALVIADWMGFPRDAWARALVWADAIVQLQTIGMSGPPDMASVRQWLALVEENRAFIEGIMDQRAPGGNDLFALLMEMEEGEVLDRAQVVAQAMIIMLAGHETTRNLIGNGVHLIAAGAADYRPFLGDELAQRLAVDEILRLSSPVQMIGRIAAEDFEFEGASLRKGDFVILGWASANRDPEHFAEPERMDLERRNNPHLAFGAGIHACLGLHLARVEAQIAFQRLWSRLPNLRLAEQPPEWNRNLLFHGPSRLYVEYDRH